MPFSFHSHSGQFCKHAFSTLEEVVQRAVEVGFTHYGLSEHMPRYETEDLYDEETEEKLTPADLQNIFEDFVKEARRLQAKYKDKIHLIIGFETEVIREESFDQIRTLKKQHELDYIVGSVHHVDGIPIDFSDELFDKAEKLAGGTEEVMLKYFDHQYQLIKKLKPEVIGHFDVIRKYRPEVEFTDILWEKIVRNVQLGISYGALFEINCSGASPTKNLKCPYPHPRIIELLVTSGAKLTVSDDSHGTGDVGFWFKNLPQYLATYGISELYYLERALMSSGSTGQENRVVCKKLTDCWRHPFWEKCAETVENNK